MTQRPAPVLPPIRSVDSGSIRRRMGLLVGFLAAASLAIAAMPLTVAASGGDGSRFVQTNLVSDVPGWAGITDASLVNAWGMSFGPTTPLWVSDNGSDLTTLYRGTPPGVPFSKVALTVSIPDGAPTGQVWRANDPSKTSILPELKLAAYSQLPPGPVEIARPL